MASLHVLQGPDKGCTYEIVEDHTILGRYSQHAHLTDHTVSRRHAAFHRDDDGWRLVDLGSSNGTYVNGDRISGDCALKHGDQIKVGGTLIAFRQRADVEGYDRPAATRDMLDVTSGGPADSAILSAVHASDQSMILASPETADAVHAWNLMYRLAEAIGVISSVKDFLNNVTEIILAHVMVDRVFILLRDEESGEFEPVAVRYRSKAHAKRERISISRTIINQVVDQRSGVLCANAVTDERFGGDGNLAASIQQLALRSVICVPIVGHDQVRGIIHLDCAMSRHTYSHEQLRLATAVGSVVGMAIENHQLTEARMRNARLAATGETVAYLSHHIRNILQGLRSGADVVESALASGKIDNVRTGWKIVQNNLERIFHLTTNMLTFSKDREPRIELVQLNQVVEDAAALAQRLAQERGVDLSLRLADIPPAPVDSDGVHQAVFNLIINAIDACPAEGGEVRLRTHYLEKRHQIAIVVKDNGPGIPPDRIGQIFLPFHSSKGQGGTGLGLAAAKKVVDELNGEIRVTSKPGEGARFTIRLPAERSTTLDLGATR